jgi:hypothetical protein
VKMDAARTVVLMPFLVGSVGVDLFVMVVLVCCDGCDSAAQLLLLCLRFR